MSLTTNPADEYAPDFLEDVITALTHGLILHINRVLKQAGYPEDNRLGYSLDGDGNPNNFKEWDVRPMETDRPLNKTPLLTYGRVIDWQHSGEGFNPAVAPTEWEKLREDESGTIVDSATTRGAQENGTLLVDGTTNFEQLDVSHNQWVSRLDNAGDEEAHTFIDAVIAPHKIRLQDSLLYDSDGGEDYKIWHTKVRSYFNDTGISVIRYAVCASDPRHVTALAKAMRHFFVVKRSKQSLIDNELARRDADKESAWVQIEDIGRITPTNYVLSENEKSKGVRHRRELEITLRASEYLKRIDKASEYSLLLESLTIDDDKSEF